MHDQIKTYYRGERVSSAIFITYGAMSLIGSLLYFFLTRTPMSHGLFYSVGLIGLGIMIIGIARFWKSIRLYNAAMTPDNLTYLQHTEYKRLEAKDQKFQNMRVIMTIGVLIGFGFLIVSTATQVTDFFVGTAIGLTLHCGYILAFDLFAQYRMKEYMHHLHKIL